MHGAQMVAFIMQVIADNVVNGNLLQVIADNVGDNVGDIAGMGSDLFGSYAEASCAALVVASISSFGNTHDFTAMMYPLIVSSVGILVCLITTLFATDFFEVKTVKQIEPALKNQLIISTVLMTIGIALVSWVALPSSFTIFNFGTQKVVENWQLFLCVCVVQDVADSCRTGAAKNLCCHVWCCGSAFGNAERHCSGLAIDAYAEYSGKGLRCLVSAALVSLALFGAFVSRAEITTVKLLYVSRVFVCLAGDCKMWGLRRYCFISALSNMVVLGTTLRNILRLVFSEACKSLDQQSTWCRIFDVCPSLPPMEASDSSTCEIIIEDDDSHFSIGILIMYDNDDNDYK
ncbi:pyrophosphate-energized vacuolar membrane proton pump-like protein [Tanacetum coccineum]